MSFNVIPAAEVVSQSQQALTQNGFNVLLVENGAAAKAKVLEILPEKAEVMTMTSVTLDTLGISEEINKSAKYTSVKTKLMAMDRKTQSLEMQKMGAAPEWAIGSVHAITAGGEVYIASRTGSQLPAYAYGASHVIWMVGTQKLVADNKSALQRIYEYCLPLEAERARQAYGVSGSAVVKILRVNKEEVANRTTIILVNEVLGF
jgi:hypothetical protein